LAAVAVVVTVRDQVPGTRADRAAARLVTLQQLGQPYQAKGTTAALTLRQAHTHCGLVLVVVEQAQQVATQPQQLQETAAQAHRQALQAQR
jgi:hypothetical protein